MLEVVDLEIDLDISKTGSAPRHADVVDVPVMLGDDLCDLCQRSRLVHGLHSDARRKTPWCLIFLVPAHVEPSLGVVLELAQGWRLDRVNGDALARRENADNAIA